MTLGLCHHKEQLADDRQVNLLAGVVESQTWHTNLPDGTVRIQFSNGQQETRAVTGETTIAFPDGTKKTISVTGEERIAAGSGSLLATRRWF